MNNADRTTAGTGAGQTAGQSVADFGDDLISPADLRKISQEGEMAKLREAAEHDEKLQKEHDALRDAFMNQHVRPNARERLSHAVREAAGRGAKEIQIVRFPSSYLSDGGRAINNFESNWPSSLTGFAREAYEVFDQHLRPKGYTLRAQIIDYPGGMPGDVALFLCW